MGSFLPLLALTASALWVFGPGGAVARAEAAGEDLTVFLAGDTIITLPWSGDRYPAFRAVVDEMRGADVAIVNFEMTLQDGSAHAQADSGGGWIYAPPAIAGELAWAGVDMAATANNHAFDWGPVGILQTAGHLAAAGIATAGTGKDLQAARAPAMRRTRHGDVALIAAASSFTPYGRASRSRPDLAGRPGLNPLATVRGRYLELTPGIADGLWRLAGFVGVPRRRLDDRWFELLHLPIREGSSAGVRSGRRVDPGDRVGNLAAVRRAAAEAELVVFTVHAHQQGTWLTEFAHEAVDAGADIVFAHGPHQMRGLEIYAGAPIIYGLGDFVVQPEQTAAFPIESYQLYGLADDAGPDDVRHALMSRNRLFLTPEPWESVAAVLRFRHGALRQIKLVPLDLGRALPQGQRGRPRYADPATGRRLIEYFAERSRPYGTSVRYRALDNTGFVELDRQADVAVSSRALD